jgi:AraC-like DNA-binding protein
VNLAREQPSRVDILVLRPRALPGVGVARFSREGHLMRYVPEYFASVLHLAGRTEWTQGTTRYRSGPGTIDLKIPGEVHTERARFGRGQSQVLVFAPELVAEASAALDLPLVVPQDNAIDSSDPRGRPLAALHRRLLDGDATPAELEHDLCAALSALVELTHAPRGTRPKRSAWSTAVARARALLDARYTETITLDELAAHARLDKFRLCRAFSEEVGLPPHAYVTHRRVSRAQTLLANGLSQAEVAAGVGLYDQSQLHRHFKRIVGVTPGAYARAMR